MIFFTVFLLQNLIAKNYNYLVLMSISYHGLVTVVTIVALYFTVLLIAYRAISRVITIGAILQFM